jgi:hypothetical protein
LYVKAIPQQSNNLARFPHHLWPILVGHLKPYVGSMVEVKGMDTSTSEQVASPSAKDVGQKASENPFWVASIPTLGGTCAANPGK